MAVINGKDASTTDGGDDHLTGGAEADIIYAYDGNDTLNGMGGNDTLEGGRGDDILNGGDGDDVLIGGVGNDHMFGDAGNDTFTYELTTPNVLHNNIVDGGTGDDTLVASLSAGDTLVNSENHDSAINGTTFSLRNVEYVKVANYGDYLLDLSADAIFGTGDNDLISDDGDAVSTTLSAMAYTASTGVISTLVADQATGVQINGVSYGGTNQPTSFATTNGGTVAVTYVSNEWVLTYTPAANAAYVVGDASSAADDIGDDALTAIVTDASGNTMTVAIDLSVNYDANIDASGATEGLALRGDAQENVITGSAYDDVIYAGATAANEADTISGGAGDDIIGGKGGADVLAGEAGEDTIFGGAGNDSITGGADDDVIWAGADVDTVDGGTGNDILGGGAGADAILGGEGDDIIYAGAGEDNDYLRGDAGADTIYAGAGSDTVLGGDGDDEIFNGAGNDTAVGGAGADTIWGSAGNDLLVGQSGDDVFAFAAGNGNDTIDDFALTSATLGETGDVLDLSAFGFANTAAVLAATSDVGGDATIAIAPGQTITLDGLVKSDLQAATDDWVIV